MHSGAELALLAPALHLPFVLLQAAPGKMEFQMMEGTLERKHVLQTGGRKVWTWLWGSFGTGVLGCGGVAQVLGWERIQGCSWCYHGSAAGHSGRAEPVRAGRHFEWQGTTCLLPNLLASQLSPACVLQANCRAWGLFHAVLMRQTLCFYQDRRDSLKVWWGRVGWHSPAGAKGTLEGDGSGVWRMEVGCPCLCSWGGKHLPTLLLLFLFSVL